MHFPRAPRCCWCRAPGTAFGNFSSAALLLWPVAWVVPRSCAECEGCSVGEFDG